MPARNFDALVEEHVRRWELEQRAPRPRARVTIAISRLPKSGGEELASRVAERLGYELFGRELVDYIAREHNVQRRLIASLDEHARSAIDRYVDAFRTGAFTESDYLKHVVRAITTIGHRGGAVILGRGAAYVLEPERTLRVLVVAPAEQRRRRLVETEGVSSAEAARQLEKRDEQRREFLATFGVEREDPALYDLVVNTATLGMDAAIAQVVSAAEGRLSR